MKKSMLKIFVLAMSLAMALTACGEKDTPQDNLSDQSDIQYPAKPITIVVPFGAGGTTDIAARILADNLPGYLDNATTFAEGHGGGGSGSDLKWDRDDDEDSRQWARRCLRMASKMMRPAGGKSRKR